MRYLSKSARMLRAIKTKKDFGQYRIKNTKEGFGQYTIKNAKEGWGQGVKEGVKGVTAGTIVTGGGLLYNLLLNGGTNYNHSPIEEPNNTGTSGTDDKGLDCCHKEDLKEDSQNNDDFGTINNFNNCTMITNNSFGQGVTPGTIVTETGLVDNLRLNSGTDCDKSLIEEPNNTDTSITDESFDGGSIIDESSITDESSDCGSIIDKESDNVMGDGPPSLDEWF